MKTPIQILKAGRYISEIVLILSLTLSISCNNDDVEPPIEEIVIESTTNSSSKFTIVSNNITETENGYEFDGVLRAESENGEAFDIVDGEITIEMDEAGNITNISGEGAPNFPNIENFAAIVRDFDWKEEVWSHIEFKKGRWYKTQYNTDFPLNDDVFYFHFQVLDEERGDQYELKNKANDKFYHFNNIYINPYDPSLFFKVKGSLIKKLGSNGVTKKLMKKISDKATADELAAMATSIGNAIPELSIGFSNNGKIMSTSYEFKSNGYFQELYDFSGFDSRPSHFYTKLKDVPIPYTKIIKYTGDAFIHIPEGRLIHPTRIIQEQYDWGKYLGDTGTESLDLTFTGSLYFGGKAIGAILGVLPTANTIFKTDIFNSDINLDFSGGTEQIAVGDDKTSLNYGLEGQIPIVKILDPSLTQWMLTQVASGGFFYLSIDADIENWVIHYELDNTYPVNLLGALNTKGYLSISKEGLLLGGEITSSLLYGIMEVTNGYTGSLSTTGFEITTLVDKEIGLPWFDDISFTDTELTTTIANNEEDGASVIAVGTVNLPLGIASADVTIELSDVNGFKAEGEFTSNLTILDTEIEVAGGTGFTFKAWHYETDNVTDKGFEFSGYINAPGGIGQVLVEGSIVNGDLNLAGSFDGNVNFNGVNLVSSNGRIEISSADGFKISANFELPNGLGSAYMSGYVTDSEFNLEGNMQSRITVNGNQFAFTQANISASNTNGVNVSGKIDLGAFKANVSGEINPNMTFAFNGNANTDINCKIKSNINVKVHQNGVVLSGTGSVFIINPLPNQDCLEFQGSINFNPLWGGRNIIVCVGLNCNILNW